MKKISIVLGVALILGMQGCGGSGASSDDKTNLDNKALKMPSKNSDKLENLGEEANENRVEQEVFVLSKKLEVFGDHNETTTYTYKGNYVAESNTTTTNGYKFDKLYSYDSAKGELVVKVKNLLGDMELTQRVKFEDGDMTKHIDLGRNASQMYLFTTFDAIAYFDHKRAIESVKDIEKELYNTEYYTYKDGRLSDLKVGYKDSLDGKFTLLNEYEYSYSQDRGNLSLDHTFEYSDDNKTVTEKDGDSIVRVYEFEVVGG